MKAARQVGSSYLLVFVLADRQESGCRPRSRQGRKSRKEVLLLLYYCVVVLLLYLLFDNTTTKEKEASLTVCTVLLVTVLL